MSTPEGITTSPRDLSQSPYQDAETETIEADVDVYADSGYDDESIQSSSISLSSSSFEYCYAHGHLYHRDGLSLLPIDETEQDRLDLQHHIFKLVLDGRLTCTDLPPTTQTILDVGTGTGIWAIDVGDNFPSATVIGVDESPIQPTWVPPNVKFEIDDVNKPWLREERSIDFIHIRTMAGSITNWPELLAEAFRALKPGGMMEFTEFGLRWECVDGTFDPNANCGTWTKRFHEIASEVLCIDFDPISKMAGWMGEAGFKDVVVTDKIVPVGPWPRDRKLKDIGKYFLSNMLEGGVENYTLALFTKAGWDETSVHAMLGGVRRELLDPRIHAFTRAWFITGTRPQ